MYCKIKIVLTILFCIVQTILIFLLFIQLVHNSFYVRNAGEILVTQKLTNCRYLIPLLLQILELTLNVLVSRYNFQSIFYDRVVFKQFRSLFNIAFIPSITFEASSLCRIFTSVFLTTTLTKPRICLQFQCSRKPSL